MTIYLCDDDRRRQTIFGQPGLNGIDYIEVLDQEAPPNLRQQILNVSFINAPAPAGISPANVEIVGGERITGVQVTSTSMTGDTLVVQVNEPGDFSEYTLRIVDSAGREPYPGLDPALSEIPFSFKVECPTDFDCAAAPSCTPATPAPPDINYLAKDFTTFVTLMQNRVSLLAPRWRETSPADIGVTLIELLAYIADRLSYRQDAVATEAYLATARQRISVRRHARLVDYPIQEGCNARVWICVGVNADVSLPAGNEFLTTIPGTPLTLAAGSQALTLAKQQNPQSFQSMLPVTLRVAHSAPLKFHNWGGLDCCLPPGPRRRHCVGHTPISRQETCLSSRKRAAARQAAPMTQIHAVALLSASPASPCHRTLLGLASFRPRRLDRPLPSIQRPSTSPRLRGRPRTHFHSPSRSPC